MLTFGLYNVHHNKISNRQLKKNVSASVNTSLKVSTLKRACKRYLLYMCIVSLKWSLLEATEIDSQVGEKSFLSRTILGAGLFR